MCRFKTLHFSKQETPQNNTNTISVHNLMEPKTLFVLSWSDLAF